MPSYEKNKSSGLWSCRFREKDENDVNHQKRLSGFSTKREAQYAYEDYIKNNINLCISFYKENKCTTTQKH
ncbi:MAG: Arm DNA-binding domain-containing protein [Clostridia bacterium]|nr:Arm DNA-binding domain-containing protein [Clostridia bacterium]